MLTALQFTTADKLIGAVMKTVSYPKRPKQY